MRRSARRKLAVDRRVDAGRGERSLDDRDVLARRKARVGEQRDARESELARTLSGFARARRRPNVNVGIPDGESAIASLDGGKIGVASRT
jgi:hypothetical protein